MKSECSCDYNVYSELAFNFNLLRMFDSLLQLLRVHCWTTRRPPLRNGVI